MSLLPQTSVTTRSTQYFDNITTVHQSTFYLFVCDFTTSFTEVQQSAILTDTAGKKKKNKGKVRQPVREILSTKKLNDLLCSNSKITFVRKLTAVVQMGKTHGPHDPKRWFNYKCKCTRVPWNHHSYTLAHSRSLLRHSYRLWAFEKKSSEDVGYYSMNSSQTEWLRSRTD